jgi:hypothetical protein
MKERGVIVVLAGAIVLVSTSLSFTGSAATESPSETLWPTKG